MTKFSGDKNLAQAIYKLACSKENANFIRINELLNIFSYKFDVSTDTLEQTKLLESLVLKNVVEDCDLITLCCSTLRPVSIRQIYAAR